MKTDNIEYAVNRIRNTDNGLVNTVYAFKIRGSKCLGFASVKTIGLDGVE